MSDNGQRQQSKFAETAASLPNAWKPGRIVRVGDTLYLDDGSTWIRLPDGGGGGVDALAELSDVDVSDAEEGDTLVLASGVWKASAPAGGRSARYRQCRRP